MSQHLPISFSSIILSNPQYRMALIYNIVDKVICEKLDEEFGQAQIRFQIGINKDKIEIIFYFLNRYYLNYLKTNEEETKTNIINQVLKNKLGSHKIYFKYRV
jgi:hypothetical protein